MSVHIHKSHNVSVLIYHLVCPAKYRRVVVVGEVDAVLRQVCLEIAERYQVHFLEIGTDGDHVHFLIQSVPTYSPTRVATIVKSITAREVFRRAPEVKKLLWGGEFWSDGYYVSTVGRAGGEHAITKYVREQGTGKAYSKIHSAQLRLF